MHVPELKHYRYMRRRSNRKFLAAGISAFVMLGSTSAASAQDASTQHTSPREDIKYDLLAQKLREHGIHTLVTSNVESPEIQSSIELAQSPSNGATGSSSIVLSANASSTPSTAASILETYGTLPPVSDINRSSTPFIGYPITSDDALANESLANTQGEGTSSESVEYTIDPTLQGSLDLLLESAEALAQDIPLQDSVAPNELAPIMSAPERSTPTLEFAQETSQDAQDIQDGQEGSTDDLPEPSEEQDGIDGVAPADETPTGEIPSEEATVEEDQEEGNEFDIDSEVLTEAAALIAPPPDYLNSNPNPLYFPTEPEEVEIVGNQPITLEQALALARQNSRDLQTAILQFERAQADLRVERAARIPTLTVTSDITHQDLNPALEATDVFGNPVDSDDNTTTLNGSVQIDYDLFTSGSRNASIRAAERAVRLQELQIEVVTEELGM